MKKQGINQVKIIRSLEFENSQWKDKFERNEKEANDLFSENDALRRKIENFNDFQIETDKKGQQNKKAEEALKFKIAEAKGLLEAEQSNSRVLKNDLKARAKENQELKAKMATSIGFGSREKDSYSRKVMQLEKTISSLQKKVIAYEANDRKNSKKIEKSNMQNNLKLQNYKDEILKSDRKMASLEDLNKHMQLKNQKIIKGHQKEMKDLMLSVDALNKTIGSIEKEKILALKQKTALVAMNSDLKNMLKNTNKVTKEKESFKKQNDMLYEKNRELKKQMQQKEQQFSTREGNLNRNQKELSSELQNLRKQVESQKRDIAALEDLNKHIQIKSKEVERDLGKKNLWAKDKARDIAQNENLKQELKKEKNKKLKWANQVGRMEKEMAGLRSSIKDYRGELNKARKQKDLIVKLNVNTQDFKEKQEALIVQLKEDNAEFRKNRDVSGNQVSMLNILNKDLQMDIQLSQKENKELKRQVDDFKKREYESVRNKDGYITRVENLGVTIGSLKKELHVRDENVESLNNKFDIYQRDLGAKLHHYKDELLRKNMKLDSLRDEMNILRARKEELAEDYLNQQIALSSSKEIIKENDTLKQEMRFLKRKNRDLQNETADLGIRYTDMQDRVETLKENRSEQLLNQKLKDKYKQLQRELDHYKKSENNLKNQVRKANKKSHDLERKLNSVKKSRRGKALLKRNEIADSFLEKDIFVEPEPYRERSYQRKSNRDDLMANLDDHYLDLAEEYFSRNKYIEAIEVYQRILRRNPSDDTSWVNQGLCYAQIERYQQAIRCYRKALEINRYNESAHYNLGVAYFYMGNVRDAIEEYFAVIRMNPNHAAAHYNLALAYEDIDKRKAYDQWLRYLDVARSYPDQKVWIMEAKKYLASSPLRVY